MRLNGHATNPQRTRNGKMGAAKRYPHPRRRKQQLPRILSVPEPRKNRPRRNSKRPGRGSNYRRPRPPNAPGCGFGPPAMEVGLEDRVEISEAGRSAAAGITPEGDVKLEEGTEEEISGNWYAAGYGSAIESLS